MQNPFKISKLEKVLSYSLVLGIPIVAGVAYAFSCQDYVHMLIPKYFDTCNKAVKLVQGQAAASIALVPVASAYCDSLIRRKEKAASESKLDEDASCICAYPPIDE